MSDIVKRLRGAADAAARTLSDNSMMPPEMSGLGDAEAEDLVFLCRDASDHIEALDAEVAKWRQCWEDDRRDVRYFAKAMTAQRRAAAAEARATSLEQRLRDAGVE